MNKVAETEFEEMVHPISAEKTPADHFIEADLKEGPADYEPEWSEYLLDQLSDHELINGAPTVDGLRRIAEKCFGEIVDSRSQIVETPSSENGMRCTVCHTLRIIKYRNGQQVQVDGCVDVVYHKTPYPFKDHLVATADTRAEGKALRRALKIRVITAEELQHEDEEDALSSDEAVNDQQILAVNQLCKRLNVSVAAITKGQYNTAREEDDLRNLEARLLISKLSELQRTPDDIPESYVGYDENWKSDFYGSQK
jgi:hypothetical protein